jgi:hypothetical protein
MIIRIGKRLEMSLLVLDSLTATTYWLNMIMLTQLSAQESTKLSAEDGLLSTQMWFKTEL